MASLRIPESHRVGLAKLRQISDENTEAIVSALQRLPLTTIGRKDMTSAISTAVPNLPAGDVEKIAGTLFALYIVRASADVSLTKFAVDVSCALRDGGEQFTEEEFARFKERMEKLLGVETFLATSKALSLQVDHENAFCEAKILTDVRTVFGANPEGQPVGFVITHILKIGHHDAGANHRDFYVALDEDDLMALRGMVERAEKKATSIASLMSKTGIRNFTTK